MTTTDHPETPEFIFGPLSTEAGRVQRARAELVGLQHVESLEPADPRPGEDVEVSVRAGLGVDPRAVTLHYTVDGSRPDPGATGTTSLALQRTATRWETLVWSFVTTWGVRIPGQPNGTIVQYTISAVDADGRELSCPHVDISAPAFGERPEAFDRRYLHHLARARVPQVQAYVVDELEIPAWLREAVIYQVLVDRFAPAPGGSFSAAGDLSAPLGGTLRGLRERLPYLLDLGVTALWLSPIVAAPSSHGYDAVDLWRVEPRLGTEEDLRELIVAAHAAGLRIVLDFVANHVSRHHPAFVAAQADAAGAYGDWFFFREHPHDYEAYYDLPELPILDTDLPAVREELIGAARHWLGLGCDGFRLDHAHGATRAFWSAFRHDLRGVDREAVTFGEITDTPATMRSFAGRMDGVLDFALLELLRGFFAYDRLTASQFDRGLRAREAWFEGTLALPSFLDNHDMNRFSWAVGGDTRRLRVAALCQFTLPGPPIIYYGTEVGLSQRRGLGRLEEARLPMPWGSDQDGDLLRFYRSLIALRRAAGWTTWRDRTTLLVDDELALLAYRCSDQVVALNNGEASADLLLPEGELALATADEVTWTDGWLHLPPRSGALLRSVPEER